jgi:hypothetical protein
MVLADDHVNGVRTRSWPSQRPIETGRPAGGDTRAHVIVVPELGFEAVSAEPMNVPVGERSATDRDTPQFVIVGVPISWLTASINTAARPRVVHAGVRNARHETHTLITGTTTGLQKSPYDVTHQTRARCRSSFARSL